MLGKILSFLEKVEEGEIEEEDRIRREFVIWRREKKGGKNGMERRSCTIGSRIPVATNRFVTDD